jgi:hypothetical protein
MNDHFDKLQSGKKLRFVGLKFFWFTDVSENGKSLKLNEIYTLEKYNIHSSWVSITLKETGDKIYSYSWFEPVEENVPENKS